MREWVSLNGQLLGADAARVSVFDSSLMQGVGLFETMRAYNGVVFRLDAHLERLRNSARALGWTTVPTADNLKQNVQQALQAVEDADARVRLTVTTGTVRPLDTEEAAPLTIIASATAGVKYPDELYRKGVTVVVSDYRQGTADPIVGHKTTSYFSRLAAMREAHNRGAFEALWFTYDRKLAEGSISSVFVVSDGALLTPPLDTPILPGVTRAAVLELAAALGIETQEVPLNINDLLGADEVFLTNSLMEIVPVVHLERETVGDGKPGVLTGRLNEAYGALIAKECVDGTG